MLDKFIDIFIPIVLCGLTCLFIIFLGIMIYGMYEDFFTDISEKEGLYLKDEYCMEISRDIS